MDVFDEDVNKVDNNEGVLVCTLQQLLLQRPGNLTELLIVTQHVDARVKKTLSNSTVSTVYWCNNEGGIMPSPDEVHQSAAERNTPR